jgi:acetyl/propionyl-CoA carboxylase alpha subunit
MNFSFWFDDKEYRINLHEKGHNNIQVSLGRRTYSVGVELVRENEVLLNIDGKVYNIIINSNSASSYSVYLNGKFFNIKKKSISQILETKREKSKKQDIKTSMPGRVVEVLVKEGEKVKEGQSILVLEAMKMQNEIKSPQTGTVIRISPRAGDSVEAGSLLFSVE